MWQSEHRTEWIPPEEAGLTDREQEILRLVAQGLANKEIAYRLGISQNTVKVHLRNIFSKTNLQSRTEAAMYAVRFGLVALTPSAPIMAEEEEEAPALGEPLAEPEESPEPTRTIAPTLPTEGSPVAALPRGQAALFLIAILLGLAWALGPAPAHPEAPDRVFQGDQRGQGIERNEALSRWKLISQMPTPRARFALARWRDWLIAIGGEAPEGITDRVERFDLRRETWERGAPKPYPVAAAAAGTLGDRIYVPGGVNPQGQPVDRLEIYDPQADRWLEGPPLPGPLAAYALAVAMDRLYLFGGWDGRRLQGAVWMLDPARGRWEPRAPMPTPRAFAAAAVLDEAIYVVGGYDGQRELATCERYRFTVDRWEPCPPLNVGRGGLALAAMDGYLFAIGGGWRIPLAFNERYQPGADRWTPFETPITGTWRNLSAVPGDGGIWILGGWSGEPRAGVWRFTPFPFRLFLPATQR
ncbi:LuxR C-terminal-related transcriptional regulator [Thermoflexus sp.]|uniref:Kelch repeat-containing protein n=1 Tax=Thermoflexus sp. TaxID=1969742 RepID=UPI002ADE8941|nr:LuxR C-terminal-related transcriptional regulator [Thermoflexus sp.]